MQKLLLTATVALCCAAYCADNTSDDTAANKLLEAYSSMQYPQAKKLAAGSKRPEFQLIYALCEVYDRRAQNLKHGMPELERLSKDPSLPEKFRPTAKLAYARAMHTLGLRKNVYTPAEGFDPEPLYNEIISTYPDKIEAVYAVIYRAQYNMDKGNIENEILRLEKFLNDYKGPVSYTGSIHFLLAQEYIRTGKRYAQAVKHYEKFRDAGIANPRNQVTVMFQIARIYDFYLKDKVSAEREYLRFLKEHPNSSEAIVAKRYLKELKAEMGK